MNKPYQSKNYGARFLDELGGVNLSDTSNKQMLRYDGSLWVNDSNLRTSDQVAIGTDAGLTSQGTNAVAIGYNAGSNSQGTNCIAIGNQAGLDQQPSGSIVISASNGALNATAINQLHIKPIRGEALGLGNPYLLYNAGTGEIFYSTN